KNPSATHLSTAQAWCNHANKLAQWVLDNLVVRRDAWGFYKPDNSTRTYHYGNQLNKVMIMKHYLYPNTCKPLGFHFVTPGDEAKGIGIDIDNHDDTLTPEQLEAVKANNFKIAYDIGREILSHGLVPIIEASNGKGGYHIRVIFDEFF